MFDIICGAFLIGLMVAAGLAILAIPVMAWKNSKTMDEWN